MLPLEVDEEKLKKGLKILTLSKLLTRLPILLAQIKVRNISCKLKNEIRQILYLLYDLIKLLKKFNQVQKFNQVDNGRKHGFIREPETFCFDFDWPKDVEMMLRGCSTSRNR